MFHNRNVAAKDCGKFVAMDKLGINENKKVINRYKQGK